MLLQRKLIIGIFLVLLSCNSDPADQIDEKLGNTLGKVASKQTIRENEVDSIFQLADLSIDFLGMSDTIKVRRSRANALLFPKNIFQSSMDQTFPLEIAQGKLFIVPSALDLFLGDRSNKNIAIQVSGSDFNNVDDLVTNKWFREFQSYMVKKGLQKIFVIRNDGTSYRFIREIKLKNQTNKCSDEEFCKCTPKKLLD